jgi:hypothetical protein
MRLSLMPRKSIFFTLFNQHAQNALEATQALEKLLSDFTDVDNKARDIHAIEHYGDKLTHQIMQELNGTFVTPLDREDIVGLASKLDDVTDVCHDVAEMVVLYKVRTWSPRSRISRSSRVSNRTGSRSTRSRTKATRCSGPLWGTYSRRPRIQSRSSSGRICTASSRSRSTAVRMSRTSSRPSW